MRTGYQNLKVCIPELEMVGTHIKSVYPRLPLSPRSSPHRPSQSSARLSRSPRSSPHRRPSQPSARLPCTQLAPRRPHSPHHPPQSSDSQNYTPTSVPSHHHHHSQSQLHRSPSHHLQRHSSTKSSRSHHHSHVPRHRSPSVRDRSPLSHYSGTHLSPQRSPSASSRPQSLSTASSSVQSQV